MESTSRIYSGARDDSIFLFRGVISGPLLECRAPGGGEKTPLLRGGGAAPIKQMQRYPKIGEAREVRHMLQECFDLPGRADLLR